MTKDEALKLAMDWYGSGNQDPDEFERLILSIAAQPEQEPVAWLLTDKNINSLQVDSIQRLIDRLKHAHHTDIRVRINGHDEWFEADWLKHMVRVTPPQPEQNPMSDEMLQAITDPENQPSQYGTVTLDYHFEKIKKWEDLFERMSNKVLQQLEQEPVISKWVLREVYFDEDGEPISHRSPPQPEQIQPSADSNTHQPERHELQAKGEHPAPCARHCEANAFQIVIKNLKAQLAQPEQEPVIDKSAAIRIATSLGWTPQRKPLTDEQIIANDVLRYHFALNGGAGPISKKGRKVIDAIEAAHGIKENT